MVLSQKMSKRKKRSPVKPQAMKNLVLLMIQMRRSLWSPSKRRVKKAKTL